MTIELKKLIGGGNFMELCKFVFLKMKIIGLIKPVVGKGFVDQGPVARSMVSVNQRLIPWQRIGFDTA